MAKAEKIDATPGALRLLASAAEGSLRDALSLLDQAATLAAGRVDEARCAEILALVDPELLEGMYSAVAGGDRAAAIASLARLTEGGADPRHVLQEFVVFLRRALLVARPAPRATSRRRSRRGWRRSRGRCRTRTCCAPSR